MTKKMMVEAENVCFRYSKSGKEVLKNLTFSVNRGESIGIIGANGAGKSTLLKLMVGICSDYEGSLLIDGLKVEKNNYASIRRKIGYLFQNSDNQLFSATVFEDVAFGPRNYGFTEEEISIKVNEALKKVDMLEHINKPIHHLSGGLKKRAAIASVLSLDPELFLFDEPSVALDPRSRRKLIEVVSGLEGTKIIASHDFDLLKTLCDRIILLSEGKIIKIGDTSDILSDEQLLLNNGL